MKRLFRHRVRLLATVAVILLGTLVESKAGREYCKSDFRRYFEGLSASQVPVNPVQKLIFSLLLANTKPAEQAGNPSKAPAPSANPRL